MKTVFDSHPAVGFVYFMLVIILSVAFFNPLLTVISLASAALLAVILKGKAFLRSLGFMLPFFAAVALINPLINRRGATVLFTVFGGAYTLESFLYGVFISLMFISAFFWLACFSAVFDAEKFVFLFGKLVPNTALLVSMTLRLIPGMIRRLHAINAAQKVSGMGIEQTNNRWRALVAKFKNGVAAVSILITWSMESAVTTADSMKARGFGLKDRSSFSRYRFTKGDAFLLPVFLLPAVAFIFFLLAGKTEAVFFPRPDFLPKNTFGRLAIIFFGFFAGLPVFQKAKEAVRWRYLISRI